MSVDPYLVAPLRPSLSFPYFITVLNTARLAFASRTHSSKAPDGILGVLHPLRPRVFLIARLVAVPTVSGIPLLL